MMFLLGLEMPLLQYLKGTIMMTLLGCYSHCEQQQQGLVVLKQECGKMGSEIVLCHFVVHVDHPIRSWGGCF